MSESEDKQKLPKKKRGWGKKINDSWKPKDLQSRRIVSVIWPLSQEPNWVEWEHIKNHCHKNGVESWEQEIDQRRVLYTVANNKGIKNLRNRTSRSKLSCRSGVAYPSQDLSRLIEDALLHATVYEMAVPLVGALSKKDQPGIYFYSENGQILYVGLTGSVSRRNRSHLASQASFNHFLQWGTLNAASPKARFFEHWSMTFLPLQLAQEFAVQGQIAPDLDLEPSNRNSLEIMFKADTQWSLEVAEAALIAHFRPHFNQVRNICPSPLEQREYCSQHCSVCRDREQEINRHGTVH